MVRVLQRNRTNIVYITYYILRTIYIVCIYTHAYIYGERFVVRNLLTWVWGLVKSAACGVGDPGRADVYFKFKGHQSGRVNTADEIQKSNQLENSLKLRGELVFCSNLTCNWLDEALLHYGEQSASWRVLWFQCQSQAKTLSQIPWDNTWPPIWVPHGLVKFTHVRFTITVYRPSFI